MLVLPHIKLTSEPDRILLTLLSRSFFSAGPLAFATPENASSLDASRLQTLLVAYYRILTANPNLPEQLSWPLHPLLALFRAPHPDAGVRFLAIRCHSLQTRTLEGERDELENELVGHVVEMEVPIRFEELPDGQIMTVEACLFVITEARRVQDARNGLVDGIAELYSYEHGEEVELLDLSQLRFVCLLTFTLAY
jgi:midasin